MPKVYIMAWTWCHGQKQH